MAERVVVVCDVCGSSPAETVGITAKAKNYRKDLCSAHLPRNTAFASFPLERLSAEDSVRRRLAALDWFLATAA